MNELVTPSIEALRPYEPGKPVEEVTRELGLVEVVKLASNENPLGAGRLAREAVARALGTLHRYPDAAAFRLRERLAAHLGVPRADIVHGNGSNELIELLVRTFTTPAHHVVFAEPSFVVYRMACQAHGVSFTAVPLRDHVHDLEAMAAAVRPETRLVFVCSPNNPTGTIVDPGALERFLREVPPSVIVVLDEAYVEYVDAPGHADGCRLRDLRERLVILRTFSKIHGLAALRVGYAVAPERLAAYLDRVRAPFNVGTLGQVAAVAALDDVEHVEHSRGTNRRERAALHARLRDLGLGVVPSQANFVFVDLHRPAREVFEAALQRGVIVRPLAGSWARLTVGIPAENQRMMTVLAEVLA
ncbi:MAG: histidinol-phosphate transaminase [Polyangiaceae bacterium]|nr:histidinol-phosphate transaminase [Polyangiaceae bacterium]